MKPANITIRPMTAADLDAVLGIAASLSQAPRWPRGAYLAALDPSASPRRIALAAAKPLTDVILGFTIASILPPQAELETIAVSTHAQRSGIAKQLLAALVAEIATAGGTEILLEVRASNQPARAFYQAAGFAETARRPRYYIDPVEDAILMSLRLGKGAAARKF